ncbi:MAG: DNA polymerase III subunit gamma/tau [Alphaproteobacteria bacterium]|jgi:DNA polymerase-3 subunit gamma/tau
MLFEDLPSPPIVNNEYRVLARKYRPKNFAELVGQDVLVKTISNAINLNRIPHAIILTGIRGIGKTSSARIIARSLLCIGEDGLSKSPSISPCGICENCKAIEQDRHVDVIEIDAASNTGVDNVREEIIKSVNFAPVIGRYKIFIIDEVHMLSKAAFNALLKTLEEPPANTKFILATTEIHKVPVTILSRCMRFELLAISAKVLSENLIKVANKEGFELEENAAIYLANISGGSFRDGLSLLDQALNISGSEKQISLKLVRDMLGEGEEEVIFSIFNAIIEGDSKTALSLYETEYFKGLEAFSLISSLLETLHNLNLIKNNSSLAKEIFFNQEIKSKALNLAEKLSTAFLTKLWQVLIKGLEELKITPSQYNSAQMLIIKACYVSEIPDFLELLKKKLLTKELSKEEAKTELTFSQIVELARNSKEEFLFNLLANTRVIKFSSNDKIIELAYNSLLGKDFDKRLRNFLQQKTGSLWQVNIIGEEIKKEIKSLNEQYKDDFNARIEKAKESDEFKKFAQAFPSAKLIKTIDLSNKEVYQMDEKLAG